MNESIFSRLFRYKQTEKMSPKENYLTEMLAWMIDACRNSDRIMSCF